MSALATIEQNQLSDAEHSRRVELEGVIRAGLDTYLAVGNALLEIRDSKLYRNTHHTFEDYSREKWSMSKTHANRLIQAADVVASLPPGSPAPATESQARELAAIADPDERARVWAKITNGSSKPTAAAIKAATRPENYEQTKGEIYALGWNLSEDGSGYRVHGITVPHNYIPFKTWDEVENWKAEAQERRKIQERAARVLESDPPPAPTPVKVRRVIDAMLYEASESAASLDRIEEGKVSKIRVPFEYEGQLYTCLGGVSGGNGGSHNHCMRLAQPGEPLAECEPLPYHRKDVYKGWRVSWRGKEYVLSGEWLIVTKNSESAKAGTPHHLPALPDELTGWRWGAGQNGELALVDPDNAWVTKYYASPENAIAEAKRRVLSQPKIKVSEVRPPAAPDGWTWEIDGTRTPMRYRLLRMSTDSATNWYQSPNDTIDEANEIGGTVQLFNADEVESTPVDVTLVNISTNADGSRKAILASPENNYYRDPALAQEAYMRFRATIEEFLTSGAPAARLIWLACLTEQQKRDNVHLADVLWQWGWPSPVVAEVANRIREEMLEALDF